MSVFDIEKPKRKVKLQFSHRTFSEVVDDKIVTGKRHEAQFTIKGRSYCFCHIRRCDTKEVAYYIEMVTGWNAWDFLDYMNPVDTLVEAKQNARKIIIEVLKDFDGIKLKED